MGNQHSDTIDKMNMDGIINKETMNMDGIIWMNMDGTKPANVYAHSIHSGNN